MLYIYCAGSYSTEIHDLALRLEFEEINIAYIDDSKISLDPNTYSHNIYTPQQFIKRHKPEDKVVIANGNPLIKEKDLC